MLTQKRIKLTASRIPGETSRNFNYRQADLSGKTERQKIPPDKLFADLLKRQARAAMAAVTECEPVAMPHALAGLAAVKETIAAAIHHGFTPGAESLRSGEQLIYPETLADLLACIEITRKQHRAPVFLNSRETELAKLNQKIDLLASMVASVLGENFKMPGAFCKEESEAQG